MHVFVYLYINIYDTLHDNKITACMLCYVYSHCPIHDSSIDNTNLWFVLSMILVTIIYTLRDTVAYRASASANASFLLSNPNSAKFTSARYYYS